MDYLVYIMYSPKRSRYYVGQTHNIEDRVERHKRGWVPSTKSGLPWQLIKVIKVANRSEAIRLEMKVKKRGIKRFLQDNQFGVYHACSVAGRSRFMTL